MAVDADDIMHLTNHSCFDHGQKPNLSSMPGKKWHQGLASPVNIQVHNTENHFLHPHKGLSKPLVIWHRWVSYQIIYELGGFYLHMYQEKPHNFWLVSADQCIHDKCVSDHLLVLWRLLHSLYWMMCPHWQPIHPFLEWPHLIRMEKPLPLLK